MTAYRTKKNSTTNKPKKTYTQKPFKKAKNASWLDIVWRAVHQLAMQHPAQEYFHYFQDICRFIDTNWESLAFGKDKTSTWTNTVSSTITTHKRVFKPGPDQGYWGLRIHPDEDYDASTLKDDLPEELEAENQANLRLWKINKNKKTKSVLGSANFVPSTTFGASKNTTPKKRGRKPLNRSNTEVSTINDDNSSSSSSSSSSSTPQIKSSTLKKMQHRKKLVAADNNNSNLNVVDFELTPIENRRKRKTGWGEKKAKKAKLLKSQSFIDSSAKIGPILKKNFSFDESSLNEDDSSASSSSSTSSSSRKQYKRRNIAADDEDFIIPDRSLNLSYSASKTRRIRKNYQQQYKDEESDDEEEFSGSNSEFDEEEEDSEVVSMEQLNQEEFEPQSSDSESVSESIEEDQQQQPIMLQQQQMIVNQEQSFNFLSQQNLLTPATSVVLPDPLTNTINPLSITNSYSTFIAPGTDVETFVDCPSPSNGDSLDSDPTDEEDEYVDIVTVSESEDDVLSGSEYYDSQECGEFYEALHSPFEINEKELWLQSFDSVAGYNTDSFW